MGKTKIRNIGLAVNEQPKKECEDKNCPFHGKVSLRGRIFTGEVMSSTLQNTIKIEWPRLHYIPKYERYEKRISRIKVHVPNCFDIQKGNTVKVMETRPISKSKNFVVIEVIKR